MIPIENQYPKSGILKKKLFVNSQNKSPIIQSFEDGEADTIKLGHVIKKGLHTLQPLISSSNLMIFSIFLMSKAFWHAILGQT